MKTHIPLPKILLQGKFYPGDISVMLNSVSNRLVDFGLEKKMLRFWEARLAHAKENNIKAWDSLRYRLNGFSVDGKNLSIELATMNFSTAYSMGRVPGAEDLGEDYFSKGLFVTSVIRTSDSKYIFGELSGRTLMGSGVDFIGGAVCLDELEIKSSRDLFRTLYKELAEEINVDEIMIEDCYLAGIIISKMFATGLCFRVFLSITADEVLTLHAKESDEEMRSLVVVEDKDLIKFVSNISGYGSAIADMLKYQGDR